MQDLSSKTETVYNKCVNSQCLRKVKLGVVYCCTPCCAAAQGKYEIHESGPLGHTTWCEERVVERGIFTPLDWQYHIQLERPTT